LLKFCLSHPAVTCVIPGTGNPRHMLDNLQAGRGKAADQAFRERLIQAV
jgi:aryl-alcohol dehydrogenase-like predicted oxidoreductase